MTCSFLVSKDHVLELAHGATCTVPLACVYKYMGNVFVVAADAAWEGKVYAWHASAVITRFMWDGRNSMLGDCNSNKTAMILILLHCKCMHMITTVVGGGTRILEKNSYSFLFRNKVMISQHAQSVL